VFSIEPDFVRLKPHTRIYGMRAAEPHRRGLREPGVPHAHRIVGVQHREIARLLRFKQSGFGGGVLFEGMVAIQMVRRNVKPNRNTRAKAANCLELKAGKLQHVPLIWPRGADHRGHRRPNISAHLRSNV
jgi:hypothetical protein